MKKIIIKEDKERKLLETLLNEKATSNKVSIVVDFLNQNFKRADNTEMGEDGMLKSKPIVVWVDKHKSPIKPMTDEQLFYLLQNKFKNIYSDKKERDTFIKKIIKAWYYKKISKYGSILEY